MQFIYWTWVVVSTVFCAYGLFHFYPASGDIEGPLFQDIATMVIFYPSYFVLTFGIINHFIFTFIRNRSISITVVVVASLLFLLYSLTFLDFYQTPTRLIASLFWACVGMVYFMVTLQIRNRVIRPSPQQRSPSPNFPSTALRADVYRPMGVRRIPFSLQKSRLSRVSGSIAQYQEDCRSVALCYGHYSLTITRDGVAGMNGSLVTLPWKNTINSIICGVT